MAPTAFQLIGFDIREKSRSAIESWSEDRRKTFLLNESISWPLSVDRGVWPAVGLSSNLLDVEQSPLWTDYELMIHRVSNQEEGWRSLGKEIIIEVFNDEDKEVYGKEDRIWWNYTGVVNFNSSRDEFKFIGYDVADCGLISSLSNCGFDPSEKGVLRSEYAGYMNIYGLFEDLDAASNFMALSERRVSEHAPFFIYRISARNGV